MLKVCENILVWKKNVVQEKIQKKVRKTIALKD